MLKFKDELKKFV